MPGPDAPFQSPPAAETLGFNADLQQLIQILTRGHYTNREIFLRELIAEAANSLSQIQFEMLTNQDVIDAHAELAIRLTADKQSGVLTISDTGAGMTRQDMIEQLGAISKPEAVDCLRLLQEHGRPSDELIGQCTLGFHAAFLVAKSITVVSRAWRPSATAYRWGWNGGTSFTIEPADKPERGTTVQIELQPDAAEFLDSPRLKQVIQKHSDHIPFPIYLDGNVVNRQIAIWREPPHSLSAEQYAEFYTHLTRDTNRPLLYLHVVTDVPVNLRAILYVPAHREQRGVPQLIEGGVHLYAHRVLIQERSKEVLPSYLRFVVGVVDCEDLPATPSRQALQNDPVLRQIRRALSHRLLKALANMAEEQPADYQALWNEFGLFLKEGISVADPVGRAILPDLVRCHSTKAERDDQWVSLKEYVARMPPHQKAIYYILGDSLRSAIRSPHLDYFRAHDIEVLYLVDPLDSFMTVELTHYAGKPLQNVDDANLQLPTPEPARATAEESATSVQLDDLVEYLSRRFGDRVVSVRLSRRLIDSPCCLVSAQTGPERDLQRVRRLLEMGYETPRKILEINPKHALIQDMARLLATAPDDALLAAAAEQMFDNAMLLEGLLSSPADMTPRIQFLIEAALKARLAR